MGILTKDEKTMWEQYTNLNASRNKKIFFVDADESCSPDPVTFVNIVEQLVTQMYK